MIGFSRNGASLLVSCHHVANCHFATISHSPSVEFRVCFSHGYLRVLLKMALTRSHMTLWLNVIVVVVFVVVVVVVVVVVGDDDDVVVVVVVVVGVSLLYQRTFFHHLFSNNRYNL